MMSSLRRNGKLYNNGGSIIEDIKLKVSDCDNGVTVSNTVSAEITPLSAEITTVSAEVTHVSAEIGPQSAEITSVSASSCNTLATDTTSGSNTDKDIDNDSERLKETEEGSGAVEVKSELASIEISHEIIQEEEKEDCKVFVTDSVNMEQSIPQRRSAGVYPVLVSGAVSYFNSLSFGL